MEFIFELILELVLEIGVEASKSKKTPKGVRYLIIAILVLLFITVIGLIVFAGVLVLKSNPIFGVFLILIGLFVFVISIVKFREAYLKKSNNNKK